MTCDTLLWFPMLQQEVRLAVISHAPDILKACASASSRVQVR